ncbi:MAG: hypothetical protein H8D46_03585 [FCB group bacterium]|nr:hypothetical protein [FCB group bacterium]
MSFGHESKDISIAGIVKIAVISIVLLVVIIIASAQYFTWHKEALYYETVLSPESEKLLSLQSYEEKMLTTYGVLDEEKGVYRVPVELAMKQLLEDQGSK